MVKKSWFPTRTGWLSPARMVIPPVQGVMLYHVVPCYSRRIPFAIVESPYYPSWKKHPLFWQWHMSQCVVRSVLVLAVNVRLRFGSWFRENSWDLMSSGSNKRDFVGISSQNWEPLTDSVHVQRLKCVCVYIYIYIYVYIQVWFVCFFI